MVFLFDLGGVLSDIDVQGFLNRLQRLMPEGGRAGLDPDVLLAGGGDSFLHEYELGNITSAEVLQHFHAFCRPEITDEQIRQVWLSELAPVQESRKVLLRHLRQQGRRLQPEGPFRPCVPFLPLTSAQTRETDLRRGVPYCTARTGDHLYRRCRT